MQKRAARFVAGSYSYETGSMTGILGQLKWEYLKKWTKDNRRHLKQGIQDFHRKYVLVPADKAANNVVVV